MDRQADHGALHGARALPVPANLLRGLSIAAIHGRSGGAGWDRHPRYHAAALRLLAPRFPDRLRALLAIRALPQPGVPGLIIALPTLGGGGVGLPALAYHHRADRLDGGVGRRGHPRFEEHPGECGRPDRHQGCAVGLRGAGGHRLTS